MTETQAFADRMRKRSGDHSVALHLAYDPWLDNMAARPGNSLIPFEHDELAHPEQNVFVPKVDAIESHPSAPDALYYLGFAHKMAPSLGWLALGRLVHEMGSHRASSEDPTELAKRLRRDRQDGKNTLITSSHFLFPEMGYIKAVRHIATRDRRHIHQSGVLFNKLMSRQSYSPNGAKKPTKLVDRFTPIGSVYFSYPKSANSDLYGVPPEASVPGNAMFMHQLKEDLKTGGLELDAALTGSEIRRIKDEGTNALSHYAVPDIVPASVDLLRKFDQALAVTLIKDPRTKKWRMSISDLLDVNELLKSNSGEEIINMLYADSIVPAIEEFTGVDVMHNRLAPTVATIGTTAVADAVNSQV